MGAGHHLAGGCSLSFDGLATNNPPHGRITSETPTRNRSTFGTGGKTRDKDGFLKSFRKSLKSPYLRVSLSRDGEKENVDVAHMVATVDYQIYVFHPPPGNLQATHEAAGPRPAWAY